MACASCRAVPSALFSWRGVDCSQRSSLDSSAFTQDTEEVADHLISDLMGTSVSDSTGWLPVMASPASMDLQQAAARLSTERPSSGVSMNKTDANRLLFEEADAAALSFADDTALGTMSDMHLPQSPILSLHSSAGIVEYKLSRTDEVLRSSSFMAAHSPAPLAAADDFSFPCLGTPQPIAAPAPPTPQREDAVANPYTALTRFLTVAKYSTPMPAGAAPIDSNAYPVMPDSSAQAGADSTAAAMPLPAATPDLWHAQSCAHAAEPTSPQLHGEAHRNGTGFSFVMHAPGTPAPTPRLGGAQVSGQAAVSPSIFAAAGLQASESATPVPFQAAMKRGHEPVADAAAEATQAAAIASPFSAMKQQYRHEADKLRDVQSAQAHIRKLHHAFTHASPAAGKPAPRDVPPPGTPPFQQLMRHLNGSKRSSRVQRVVQSSALAAPAEHVAHPEESTADSDDTSSAAAAAAPAKAAATTGCQAAGAAAVAVVIQQAASQTRQEQCTAVADGERESAVPHIASKIVAPSDPLSSGASWLPFASLVSNIVAHRYKSPMLRFGSPAPSHRAVQGAGAASPAQNEASTSSVGTPQAVLRCPLSDRQSASGEKSSGEQSSQRKLHSLNFSGASDANECSPVSGLAKSALTGAQARSPESCADGSAAGVNGTAGCCSPPFPEVPMRAMPEGGHAGSPLLAPPAADEAAWVAGRRDSVQDADNGAMAEVELEAAATQGGSDFVLLHMAAPGVAGAEQPQAKASAPVLSKLNNTALPQRADCDEHAALQSGLTTGTMQSTEDMTALRMSVMSDTVVMGDITPRDSDRGNQGVAEEGAASATSAAPKLLPVQETEPTADSAENAEPGHAQYEASHTSAEAATAWRSWQHSMQDSADTASHEAMSPASPQLQPQDDMPELRQSASPDLHGVIACACIIAAAFSESVLQPEAHTSASFLRAPLPNVPQSPCHNDMHCAAASRKLPSVSFTTAA